MFTQLLHLPCFANAVAVRCAFFLIILFAFSFSASSQIIVHGKLTDSKDQSPLGFANIGIAGKNKGTATDEKGTFYFILPETYRQDTLTFSSVGYHNYSIPISGIGKAPLEIQLSVKVGELQEFTVVSEKLVEKKFGIKSRNRVIHFTDGMFEEDDIFEIGQLIRLKSASAKVTSVNLFLNATHTDSAVFRVNFYRYDGSKPQERVVEQSILQKKAVQKGWLRFDLEEFDIHLNGEFVVAVEFFRDLGQRGQSIQYEVKIGGASRSFYRRSSLGEWNTPPHHYCLYVTAVVDESHPEDVDDRESEPDFRISSASVNEIFSIFVSLPKNYHKSPRKNFPVVYLLDGNAYFDQMNHYLQEFSKTNKSSTIPILVGIGYGNAYKMDSLRVRDYTYPRDTSISHQTGGAERFHRFITDELIPEIDRTYRTTTDERTLMGHSFGGFFALYSMLQGSDQSPFKNFVVASPSLGYGNAYLSELLQRYRPEDTCFKPRLFITMGEKEIDPQDGQYNQFIDHLRAKNCFIIHSDLMKGLDHMGTAVPTLEEGLNYVILP